MPILKTRHLLLITFWIAAAAALLHADTCLSPSPTLRQGKNSYAPVAARDLTPEEQLSVKRLFNALSGDWSGRAESFFCRSADDADDMESDQERLGARVSVDYEGNLTLEAQLHSEKKNASRQHRLQLFQNNHRLRIDNDSGMGDVELIRVGGSAIEFLYRRVIPLGSGSSRQEHFFTLHLTGPQLTIERRLYIQGKLSSGEIWRFSRE